MKQKIRSSKGVNSPFLEFVERYWMVICGLLFFAPTILKWLKDIAIESKKDDILNSVEVNNSQNQQAIPALILSKSEVIFAQSKITDEKTKKRLMSSASAIAYNLGVNFTDSGSFWDVFDPRGWTENDEEVGRLLILETHNFRVIEKLYFNVYTRSRNLSNDVLKLVDKDVLTKVRKVWSSNGQTWL